MEMDPPAGQNQSRDRREERRPQGLLDTTRLTPMSKPNSSDLKEKFSRSRWRSGGSETPCGAGSTVLATEVVRPAILSVVDRYSVRTINDAGCGDMNWIRLLKPSFEAMGVDYQGYDVRDLEDPPLPYQKLEIVHEEMRPCDLILCRDVFIHLTDDLILTALEKFRSVGKYLLSTTFPNMAFGAERSIRALGSSYAGINLEDPKFGLGESIEMIAEPKWKKGIALWVL